MTALDPGVHCALCGRVASAAIEPQRRAIERGVDPEANDAFLESYSSLLGGPAFDVVSFTGRAHLIMAGIAVGSQLVDSAAPIGAQ